MAFIFDKDNEYGARVIGDGGESSTDGVFKVTSASASIPAFSVGRTVTGNASQAAFKVLGASTASGALMGFPSGCISITSILTTSAAHFDYVIPVEINGEARYIPVIKGAGLFGAAV